MSVSFTTEIVEPYIYDITCSCGETTISEGHTSYSSASSMALNTDNTCEDEYCAAYGVRIEIRGSMDNMVNMSNTNATFVLEQLGYIVDLSREGDELVGSASGEDFLGRILMAEAIAPSDAGFPTIVYKRDSNEYGDAEFKPETTLTVTAGSYVECGRAEGYLQGRLAELRTLAEYASEKGSDIIWA